MEIRYIKREDIDKIKWDSCVHYANNGNPYGFTWYLDNVADNWDGLVEGDYESVFPLVWNTKLMGYKQLYQPFFAQQLGIYSVHVLSRPRIHKFLEAIPEAYKYIDICLNEQNPVKDLEGFQVAKRPNYMLLLNRPYEEIQEGYSKDIKKNLKKAKKQGMTMTSSISVETIANLYKEHIGFKTPEINDAAYHAMHRIMYNALHRGRGFMSAIMSQENDVLAANFSLASHGRIINLFSVATAEGRKKSAMHLLYDYMILQNANKPLVFDFEGSAIPSIAHLFKGYGAKDVPYYQITKDNLPSWLRMAKKVKEVIKV